MNHTSRFANLYEEVMEYKIHCVRVAERLTRDGEEIDIDSLIEALEETPRDALCNVVDPSYRFSFSFQGYEDMIEESVKRFAV